MKAVIHNDDYALSYGFTNAINESFTKGITTSTSIRTNGPAFKESCKFLLRHPKLGRGIHFNLTDGPALNKNLSNENGVFKYDFFAYFAMLFFPNRNLITEIEKEFYLQHELVKKMKLKVDHVNSEKHIHMIPAIFETTCKFCKKNKIKYIRLTNEPYFLVGNLKKDIKPFLNSNIIKFILLNLCAKYNLRILKKYNLKTTDAFYGVLHTNWMDEEIIKSVIKNARNNNLKSIEILGHPAKTSGVKEKKYTSEYIKWYSKLPNRELERKTFSSQNLKNYFEKLKIKRIRFNQI